MEISAGMSTKFGQHPIHQDNSERQYQLAFLKLVELPVAIIAAEFHSCLLK